MWPVMPLHIAGFRATSVPLPASAIDLCIAIEHFLPITWARDTNAIIVPWDRSEIERGKNPLAGVATLAQEEKRAVVGVTEINPFESLGRKIALVKRWFGLIKTVQVFDPFLKPGVEPVTKHLPFDAGIVLPFGPLPDFVAHEKEVLSRSAKHIAKKQAQVCVFLP